MYKLLDVVIDHWAAVTFKNQITKNIIRFECSNNVAYDIMKQAIDNKKYFCENIKDHISKYTDVPLDKILNIAEKYNLDEDDLIVALECYKFPEKIPVMKEGEFAKNMYNWLFDSRYEILTGEFDLPLCDQWKAYTKKFSFFKFWYYRIKGFISMLCL